MLSLDASDEWFEALPFLSQGSVCNTQWVLGQRCGLGRALDNKKHTFTIGHNHFDASESKNIVSKCHSGCRPLEMGESEELLQLEDVGLRSCS